MLLQSLRMQQLSLTCRPMSFLRTQDWLFVSSILVTANCHVVLRARPMHVGRNSLIIQYGGF